MGRESYRHRPLHQPPATVAGWSRERRDRLSIAIDEARCLETFQSERSSSSNAFPFSWANKSALAEEGIENQEQEKSCPEEAIDVHMGALHQTSKIER